jgi:hypothetical protein
MPWFGIVVFKVEEDPELVNSVKFAIIIGNAAIFDFELSKEDM